ncbi:MAG: YciI family protein [Alphaproteobacteria bacterium]|nr:YciI family protein [Alphaproteobacteria bacterium]
MQFVIVANDRPGVVELRQQHRPAHLEYLISLGPAVLAAGPFLNEAGEGIGSMLIMQADNLAQVEAMAANDPFALAGVFADVVVRPWRWSIGKPDTLV